MSKKDRRYFLTGMVLFAVAGLLQVAARNVKGFATWYAHSIYKLIVGSVGRFFGLFPLSVVELLLYSLIISGIVVLIRNWKKPVRIISRLIGLVGVLAVLYTTNCGINYYAASFSSYVGLETGLYSKEELKELCSYLTEKVNEEAIADEYPGRAWRLETVKAMQRLGSEFPVLAGFYPQPKEVMISWILSVQQLCGVYSPFTVEANFNGDMPNYNIPHTMCHELSHLKGFMREDEANFIGYLGCIESENRAFRYSGYLTGWVYAGNALAKADIDAYIELADALCDQARRDLNENNEFWDRYEGKVAEVSNQVNDVYLKANGREDGVKSYGRMVDLMLAYYKQDRSKQQ